MRASATLAVLGAASLTAAGTAALAAPRVAPPSRGACASAKIARSGVRVLRSAARVARISGVVSAMPRRPGCAFKVTGGTARNLIGDTAWGTPPLIWHNGPVTPTRQTGPLVITPIFWQPAGHPMDSAYQSIITTYLAGVASSSRRLSNVYSLVQEYFGSNGPMLYDIKLGTPITDTDPLPADGCTVAGADTTGIYADGTGYDTCLDDSQVRQEVWSVVTSGGLPKDLAHLYVIFLPKHVESCFYAGSTTGTSNYCSINNDVNPNYCAYHGYQPRNVIPFANIPYPAYAGSVGYTCGDEWLFGVTESPNGNPDADTAISMVSHETVESMTDPDTRTGWYDSSGYEMADECAGIYGPTNGAPGRLFNQVISGRRYLTQEEFSNIAFGPGGGGCLQSVIELLGAQGGDSWG